MEEASSLESYLSLSYLAFSACFIAFSLLLSILRRWPWCSCHVCRAYVNASWTSEFDNLVDWYAHLLRSSPTGTVHLHVLRCTVTANPENVEHILRGKFDNYPKGKPFAAILSDLLGGGIFNADGDSWRFQRKIASLELGSVSVRSLAWSVVSAEIRGRLLPLFADVSGGGYSDRWIDLQDVFRRFAFDTICKVSFGLDPGCLELSMPASEFASAFDTATSLSAKRATAAPVAWKLKRLLNLGSERKLRRAIRLVNGLAEEVIRQKRIKASSVVDAGGSDLLSRFMASVDDEKYLRDIVISFLLAGRDTVASGLTGFFLLLSKHDEVKAALMEEISRVMGDDDENGVASYEQLRGMEYVHAAIYESLRLLPPVQFDSKFCLEDDVLPDGSFVRGGTRVMYHPYAMGRMEAVWGADCGEFRPERWLDGAGKFAPASPYRYPVFQGGPRVCLGREMAVMEMKAVVVAVVRLFDVEVIDGGREVKFAPGLTATFADGVQARVRRRRGGAR